MGKTSKPVTSPLNRAAGLLLVATLLAILVPVQSTYAVLIASDWDGDGSVVGSRSTPEASGIVGGLRYSTDEGGMSLSWSIQLNSATGLWDYSYAIMDQDGTRIDPHLAHLFLQVDSSVTVDNFHEAYQDRSFALTHDSPQAWTDFGNVDFPNPVYGIKMNPGNDNPVTFSSPFEPVWGHFAIKSGNASAWNAALEDGLEPTWDTTDFTNWVPIPAEADPIPEPSTLVLLGVSAVALAARKRRSR